MKRFIIVLAEMLLPTMVFAASESITVAGTAIGITSTLLSPTTSQYPNFATCTLETAQVRFWPDDTPTSAAGHIVNPGDRLYLEGGELRGFKAIRTGSTSGVLRCSVTWKKGID